MCSVIGETIFRKENLEHMYPRQRTRPKLGYKTVLIFKMSYVPILDTFEHRIVWNVSNAY